MADIVNSNDFREFCCTHCDGKIKIPRNLPPTTGPCPHCSGVITSPALESTPPEISIPEISHAAPATVAATPVEASSVAAQEVAQPPLPVQAKKGPPSGPPPPPAQKSGPPPVPAELIPEKPEEAAPPANTREQKPGKAGKQLKTQQARPHRSGLIPAMLVLLGVALAIGGVAYFAAQELSRNIPPPMVELPKVDPAVTEANYIRIGWQKDAYQVLNGYMAATTSSGKVPFVLNGEQLAPEIEDFYGGAVINDSDTPADGFSVLDYEQCEEDRSRGLFMMVYDLPPQFDMKEFFRPLASLEVQYGIDEADLLLSTLARVGNFAMEPMRVHAFFKRTPQGLKLDWEIFTQTKYRTFLNFVELPEMEQTGIFRVFIVEDVPEKGQAVAGKRTYRMIDPANTTDSAKVNVDVDSETGRALSRINWRDTGENQPITKTATVELKWVGEPNAPELTISNFICWEFLGLGGENPHPTVSKN